MMVLSSRSKVLVSLVLSVLVLVTAVCPLFAEDTPKPIANASVAFVPFRLITNNGTKERLNPALKGFFEAVGFTVVHGLPVQEAVKEICGETVLAAAGGDGYPSLPELVMTKIGRKLGVKYVVCGDMMLNSDRKWWGQASAAATLATVIVDAQIGQTVYTTSQKSDSKEKVTGAIALAVLIGPLAGLFGGGSKTKHEGKALENILVKTYDPFFAKLTAKVEGPQ